MEEVGSLPTMDYREVNPSYIEKDYHEHSHRQVYVGLHHRTGEKSNTRKKQPKLLITRPPKSFRWENGKKSVVVKEDDTNSEDEVTGDHLPNTAPASERVKFILGGEEEKPAQETPQLFTELEELFVCLDGNTEWKETARWYKYEEDVEEGGDRWSRPHVATLSLSSLIELKRSLIAGTVVLDMEAKTLDEIADNVLDNLISCNKLDKDFRLKVRETLLCKHRHHRDAGFRRNLSNIINRKSTNSLHNSSISKLSKHAVNANGHDSNAHKAGTDSVDCTPHNNIKMFRNYSQPAFPTTGLKINTSFDRSLSTTNAPSQQQLQHQHRNLTFSSPPNDSDDESPENKTPGFLKRLPSNAEASNILVGEVDFLDKPITAFVRLSTSVIIGDLTEVPIPTRFLFVMLGPVVSHGRYHEIGRAISTLMADDIFHDIVYRAKLRDDLIAGIDEFLENVTVLPPGEWDPSIRLDPQIHNYPKVSRRIAMESKLDTPIEHSEGASEGDDSSESENSNSIKIRKGTLDGVVRDLKVWRGRAKDIKDGISLKCLGAVFFIYLLLIAVIATIGEHNLTSSGGFMGTREHLLSLFITGILFSIFGGQPLLVISLVLPLSIFDGLLYNICRTHGIDYLPFRLWIGVWTVIFLLVFVALDLSWYLRYITRFTLEVFVVVPPLVLFTYGFVYMCRMIKAYSNLPGTFENQTCLCMKPILLTLNTTSTLLPITTASTEPATTVLNSTVSVLQNLTTTVATTINNATVINNATTSIISNLLLNSTISSTATTPTTTTTTTTTTTAAVAAAGTVLKTIYERVDNINFRDCIARGYVLEGTACNHGVYPLTSMLALSTIALIVLLTSFQHLGYLPKQVNQFFHNYATLIVIIILSAAANQFNINIRYLQVPDSYSLNEMNHRTSWLVEALGNNAAWTVILAFLPAIILTTVVFVEQQLTGCYINHTNKLLKKGHGYNFDILVIAIGVLVSSILGLPFCVSSIFLSTMHTQALTVKGGVDDFIGCSMHIKEQRLTSFLVYILIVLTPLMRPILNYIPFSVLYGVLVVALFNSLKHVQFVRRFTLLFMPKDKQPDIVYLRQVPLISVNILTVVQVVVTALACVLRGTAATIVFPLMMVLVVFIRFFLEKILPLRDILAMDESVPAIQCSWRHCRRKSKNNENVEKGVLLGDESHEDVLPDHNKDTDRVNISEELSKSTAWKEHSYAEPANGTPVSNNSPTDNTDAKKRRKKRSRGSMQRSSSKDLPSSVHPPKPRSDENELVELKPVIEPAEYNSHAFYEEQKDGAGGFQPDYIGRTSPDLSTPELPQEKSSHSNKPPSRKNSEDRRKKERGDLAKRNSSKERKISKDRSGRHESKDRNQSRKPSSHDRKHKLSNTNRPKIPQVDDTPLPPWEQPYHSPPHKDLGLLHAQVDDTPATDLTNFDRNTNESATTSIPTIYFQVPSEENSPINPRTKSQTNGSSYLVEDSGDASCEFG